MLCKSNRPHVSAQAYTGESLLDDDWSRLKLALQHLYHCVVVIYDLEYKKELLLGATIISVHLNTCEGQLIASLLLYLQQQHIPPLQPSKAINMTLSSTEGPQPIDTEPVSPHNNADLEKLRLEEQVAVKKGSVIKGLGWLDRFLAVWILLAMIIGVLLGNFVEETGPALQKGKFVGVSIPIAVGLLVMMYPILCKVRYETLHRLFRTRALWIQIGFSIFMNWIVAPLLMVCLISCSTQLRLTHYSSVLPGRSYLTGATCEQDWFWWVWRGASPWYAHTSLLLF
jgi:hypothetical protein